MTGLEVLLAWAADDASAPRCGEIGDDQEEREYEPLTAPSVPEPIPAPVKEPAHV